MGWATSSCVLRAAMNRGRRRARHARRSALLVARRRVTNALCSRPRIWARGRSMGATAALAY